MQAGWRASIMNNGSRAHLQCTVPPRTLILPAHRRRTCSRPGVRRLERLEDIGLRPRTSPELSANFKPLAGRKASVRPSADCRSECLASIVRGVARSRAGVWTSLSDTPAH